MKKNALSTGAVEALKDEVYRQMLRVEAGRPAARLGLALALLHAWISLEPQNADSEPRQWLRAISSVCLRMIGTA